MVRIPIPSLTEERRKELSRHVHKLAEEGRNSVRQVRRDANERLKKLLKDHKISEDDEKKGLDEVQKLTDSHVKHIDELPEEKGRRPARKIDRLRPIHVFLHPLGVLRPLRSSPLDPRDRHHLCRLRRPLARALRPRCGAQLVGRDSLPDGRRRCGGTAS